MEYTYLCIDNFFVKLRNYKLLPGSYILTFYLINCNKSWYSLIRAIEFPRLQSAIFVYMSLSFSTPGIYGC